MADLTLPPLAIVLAKKGVFAVMRIIEPYDDDNKYHNGAKGDYRWD
ncbi:hypothetical protein JAB6_05800 [Janthinobacterium sp. HH104]|nr:hypothetical protein [Janthinobacterium sp. HH104]OEZ88540.1 hypothetical protein JAB6_05800 [Janthinobacterium sp. HH104]